MTNRIIKALENVDTTRVVTIGNGVLQTVEKILNDHFDKKTAIIIADTNTFRVAGSQLLTLLKSARYPVEDPFIFDSDGLYAEMHYVEKLQSFLMGRDVVPLAVGSGTVNDLTKLASYRCGLRYMSVATAGSMDGYTAFGASISYLGAKQTFQCDAPYAVVADIDIIVDAPEGMNASGYADLIAKIPAGADWLMADALGIDLINQEAWQVTQTYLKDLVADPEGIRLRGRKAVRSLMEGLIMTGLGMQIAKSSRPASGAEHQFSHLWDNQHHKYEGITPSHGFKVGIGSVASEALYEVFLNLEPDHLVSNPEEIKKWWPDFQKIEEKIRANFPEKDLADQAVEQCRNKYIGVEELAKRITLLKKIWPDLKRILESQLFGPKKITVMLSAAGAPSRPESIGISRERLKKSYELAQMIRQRYTILDVVLETNMWKKLVGGLFLPGGWWYMPKK